MNAYCTCSTGHSTHREPLETSAGRHGELDGCAWRVANLRCLQDKSTNVLFLKCISLQHLILRSSPFGCGFQVAFSFREVYCTSNRPRATGKILLTTCRAWLGSDRKGSQQRAKVTNTVEAILTSRKSLHEEDQTGRQASLLSAGGRDVRQIMKKTGNSQQHLYILSDCYSKKYTTVDMGV